MRLAKVSFKRRGGFLLVDKSRAGGDFKHVTATELREILDDADVMPSRKLGQNFLIEQNTARWIVEQLNIQPGDTVVEVGPGAGALTEFVVGVADKVILIEYDSRLAEYLTKKFADRPEVTVVHQDAVKFDVRDLFQHQPIKLLGNLPYSAGGAILRTFLKGPTPVESAVLMLQKEMIDRIQAGPGTKDYGVLSLRMQAEWDCRSLRVIPPECFHPRPAIDSTVMRVTPRRPTLPVHDRRLFDELIRRGFAQRRKQLRKNLPESANWDQLSEQLGLAPTVRAEELTVEQWVEITRAADPLFGKEEGQSRDEMLTVVDENDHPIGEERREVIHRDGLRHRAVHIFVFDKRGNLFLQKRSSLKDVCPGLWDSSAAGHVDAGEDWEPCAKREVQEELGLRNVQLRKVAVLPASPATHEEFVRLYACLATGSVHFPCVEIEYGAWFTMEQVDRWASARPHDFAPGFLSCWQEWKNANPERFAE